MYAHVTYPRARAWFPTRNVVHERLMKVTVRFFASHREATGLATYVADVPEGASAAQVLDMLCDSFPKLKLFAGSSAFAINRTQVDPSTRLRDGDELALLPPMAGG